MKAPQILIILLATTLSSCELVGSLGNNQHDAELTGVIWKLASLDVAGMEVDKGCAAISLVFTGEGEVRGESERNSYTGLYEAASRDAISIGGPSGVQHLGSTRVGEPSCSRYEEYLLTLVKARSYTLDGESLRIRCDNEITLHFRTR